MFSFSNGGLSGDVPNKRPLENGYIPKYKPRKISATRDFPPMCGRNSVPIIVKQEQVDANADGVLDVHNFKSTEVTNVATVNGVGNHGIANLVESEAVGFRTAEIPEVAKVDQTKNSESVGCGVGVSNVKIECQLDEAAKSMADVEMTEHIDAVKDKVMENERLAVEIGTAGIQSQKDEEFITNGVVNNRIAVEGAESLDVMVGVVTTTATMDVNFDSVEELVTETELVGIYKHTNGIQNGSSKKDPEAGNSTALKLNEGEGLALVQNSVEKEPLLGSSLASSPSFGGINLEASIRHKNKYRVRTVSAVRDFPPNCGRNVPLPIEVESQMATPGILVNMVKVEVEQETHMLRDVLEGEAAGEMETPQREHLNEPLNICVKKEMIKTLNDDEIGSPGEMMEVSLDIGPASSNTEEMETSQGLLKSMTVANALADGSIKDTVEEPGLGENATCSSDREDNALSPQNGSNLGDDLHRTVVHGLMAAPYCPWRKGKKAVKSSNGLTKGVKARKKILTQQQKFGVGSNITVEEDSTLADRTPDPSIFMGNDDGNAFGGGCAKEVTPISMVRSVSDITGGCAKEDTPISMVMSVPDIAGDSTEPVGKEIVVHSPRQSDEIQHSHGVYPADEAGKEAVNGAMAAPDCSEENKRVSDNSGGRSSRDKKGKRKPSWRGKVKAFARKSTPKVKSSQSPIKKVNDVDGNLGALVPLDDNQDGNFPIDHPTNSKPLVFEVSLPPFGVNSGHVDARNKVRDTLRAFHVFCRKLLQQEEQSALEEEPKSNQPGKKSKRIDLISAKMIKDVGKEVNADQQYLGAVPGVEVGDEFQYRVELAIVGLHRLYQNGIDSMKLNGVSVCTSIVSSGAYGDDVENADVLIYSGQGGNVIGNGKTKEPEDQKLERGNLALKNSISARTPVRVIRGWKQSRTVDPLDPKPKTFSTYVYDGLYTVENYRTETGSHGKLVFMFELRRNPGQPELAWKELKKSSKSKVRPGVCVNDISGGQERNPICAVNTLDDEKPPPFNYTAKVIYPEWYKPIPPHGCDCTGRCSGSKKCRCTIKNGGEIPYNRNGAIVETKPLVYECGPHCKCPPSCYNRVTQRGIKIQLEIFKTESRGWGVRALSSIPSGSFICEYAGELLEDKEAEERVGNDEYLFDIGQNYSDSSVMPEDKPASPELVEGGYTIDAGQHGNVGRFINHSCSPNLYAQNVIYDHDDKRMPHVMLFAMENIPPLQELTYHYNYSIDQIHDSNGNIKVKKCYCGTAECTGRMY